MFFYSIISLCKRCVKGDFVNSNISKSLGIVLDKSPAVLAHFLNASFSSPAKLLCSLFGVCIALGNIACTSGLDNIRNVYAACLDERIDNIKNGISLACAKVPDSNACHGTNLLYCLYMAQSQVNNMDIVSYACAVVGGIIVAEYAKLGKLAHCHLLDIGHKVVGDTVGVLAKLAALVSADGVEVSEEGYAPLVVGGVDIL